MRPLLHLAPLAAVAGAGAVIWFLSRSKRDPREREARRRLEVARLGRMADGYIIDVADATLYYSYMVAGVEYTASQEVSALAEYLPESLESLIGPVTLKFMPGNPSNSVIVSEEWSGIRTKGPGVLLKGAQG